MSDLNVVAKFRAYRLEAESKRGKLKEAEIVIDQLKNELNFSKDGEKNLRSQIISGESRLICLQETLKKFLTVSAQQRQNEKVSQTIEQKLEELREKIDQTRQETQNLTEYISSDVESLEKNKKLESALHRLKNLEEDLEKAVKKESEAETHYCDMLLYYKEQIKNYEQKVEFYEKERKSLLEDFEPPISSSKNVVWTESTTPLKEDDRSLETSNSKKRNITDEESDEECNAQAFQCSLSKGKPKRVRFKKEKAINFSRTSKKQKPQLEFLTASQDSLRTPSSVEFGRKRRLFSTNCNHYLD